MHSPSLSPRTTSYSAKLSFLTGWAQRGLHRKPSDPLQNRCKQSSRHGDLRQLERHILRVPSHFRPDLYQLLPQRRRRLSLSREQQRRHLFAGADPGKDRVGAKGRVEHVFQRVLPAADELTHGVGRFCGRRHGTSLAALYYLHFVTPGHASVRKDEAGNPSLLAKLGVASSRQAYRTATGSATCSL